MIYLFTDGSSRGNPGPGGFGTVLISPAHKMRKEISGGYRRTTNNRMELLAVIVGLEALKNPGTEVTVYSDSKYVVDSVEKGWIKGWIKKGFKKNEDLWRRFLKIYNQHKVRLKWIKGHAGHKENERCDRLAVAAAEMSGLPPDKFYESEEQRLKGLL